MPDRVVMVASPIHPVPPFKGAAVEMWIYEVARRLTGFEPHVISLADPFYPLKEYREGVFFHRIAFGKAYRRIFQKMTRLDPLSYPVRVARIIEELSPSIVHMHNSIKLFHPLIERIHRKRGLKGKGSPHTILHLQNECAITAPLEVDTLVGCSELILNKYRSTPVSASRWECIRNGVDMEKYRPAWEVPALRESVRARFGIKKDDTVVLFVGRISPDKGVEHFIGSAAVLKERLIRDGHDKTGMKFFLVGEIQDHKSAGDRARYGREMRSMAAPLGDLVTFTGVFTPGRMHQLYLIGDIFVMCSNFEDPFPFVVLEAMASGLPVIARRRGGIVEYLVNGENGLYADENDIAKSIADRIDLLVKEPDTRDRLARAGRKTVEEHFTWDKITAHVEELYRHLTRSS